MQGLGGVRGKGFSDSQDQDGDGDALVLGKGERGKRRSGREGERR